MIARAAEMLEVLEKSDRGRAATVWSTTCRCFRLPWPSRSIPPRQRGGGASALEARLAAVRADELTPRQALELIYELKAMLGQGSG